MKEYERIREKRRKTAIIVGVVLTLAGHASALALTSFTGFKYIWPPPGEETFLLEFVEELEPPTPKKGLEPRSENVDKTEPIELIQKSKAPTVAKAENLTPESKPDDFGEVDVPTPKPKEEPKLDPRASFPGMAKKDTNITTPHSAEKASNEFKAGQVQGNTNKGNIAGKPNAHLKGRSAVGDLPRPKYTKQEEGVVVVSIWVDNYGKVTKAIAGAKGTTVDDTELWNEARKAAINTHFNMKADAPALQEGTITYIFKLN